jgi:hypothetical protein
MDTTATVNFPPFDDYSEHHHLFKKKSNTHPAYLEEVRNFPKLQAKSKNVNNNKRTTVILTDTCV